jgi:hypothetical protein
MIGEVINFIIGMFGVGLGLVALFLPVGAIVILFVRICEWLDW